MVGSGTVVALARLKGHMSDGLGCRPAGRPHLKRLDHLCGRGEGSRQKAREVLVRARKIFATLRQRDAYPSRSDRETRRFVAYWFDGYARRQLTALSIAVARVRDEVTRNILLCALSRLIIAKKSGVSLAMDLSHSRPHKSFERAPVKPFRKFLAAVDRVAENCVKKKGASRGPAPRVHLGDARKLPVRNSSIDLVLTSPPYLNAIDYIRCSKFSLVWMGYRIPDLRLLRAESVGAEAGRATSQSDLEIRHIIAEFEPRSSARQKRRSGARSVH